MHARVAAERAEQGLPEYIEDPALLRKVARLIAETQASNEEAS